MSETRAAALYALSVVGGRLVAKVASLNLRLVRLRRFSPLMCRRQLKHSGLLSLVKQSQKNDLAVREFQGVMVRPGDA